MKHSQQQDGRHGRAPPRPAPPPAAGAAWQGAARQAPPGGLLLWLPGAGITALLHNIYP